MKHFCDLFKNYSVSLNYIIFVILYFLKWHIQNSWKKFFYNNFIEKKTNSIKKMPKNYNWTFLLLYFYFITSVGIMFFFSTQDLTFKTLKTYFCISYIFCDFFENYFLILCNYVLLKTEDSEFFEGSIFVHFFLIQKALKKMPKTYNWTFLMMYFYFYIGIIVFFGNKFWFLEQLKHLFMAGRRFHP